MHAQGAVVVSSDCDSEVIQLISERKRCTRPAVEAQHADALKELERIEKERELAGIDRAEAAADRAEYERQGAIDRDGKPIHLPA
jgi:chorismate mutase